MMPSMLVKACGFSIFGQIFLSFWEKKTGKLHIPPSNYPKKPWEPFFFVASIWWGSRILVQNGFTPKNNPIISSENLYLEDDFSFEMVPHLFSGGIYIYIYVPVAVEYMFVGESRVDASDFRPQKGQTNSVIRMGVVRIC